MRTSSLLLLTVALAVGLASGCQSTNPISGSSAPSDTTIVATFADDSVHIEEFEQRYVRTVGSVEEALKDSVGQYGDFLERYVNFRVKLLDARRRGLEDDLYGGPSVTTHPGELARSFLVSEARTDLLRELYERRKEDVEISTITIRYGSNPTPEDTLAAYRKISRARDSIEAGMPFGEAAVQFSDSPGVAQDSGRIGWVSAGRAYRSFENRMYNTPVGEMVGPFKSRHGYYLMKIHDRRPAHPERRISHIMVSPGNQTDSAEAYAAIEKLRDSLAAGKDFARLARMYSAHRQTAGNGGDFGWMSYNQMHKVVPQFAEAAWSIDSLNTVSEGRVRSRFGYHLIKITAERDYSSFEAARSHLEERFESLPRSNNLGRKEGRKLLRKLGSSVDSSVVDRALDGLPADASWDSIVDEGLPESMNGETFATIGDSTYTVGQLSRRLEYVRQDTTTSVKLYRNVNRFMREKAFAYVVPSLRDDNPRFARILNEYENGMLLFRVSEEVVWNKAQQDTAALRALYEDIGDQYRFPRRHRTIVFRTLIDSTLKPVKEALEDGRDVSTIAEEVLPRDSDVEIDTVFVADSTNQLYGRAVSMQENEHTDIITQGTRDMILYVDGIEAPRQKTFKEARTDLLKKYQEQLEREWLADLHDRYDVRIYPDRLRYAFQDTTISDDPLPDPLPSSGAASE